MVKNLYVIMFIMFLCGCGGEGNESTAEESSPEVKNTGQSAGVIVAVGDSLTAGYGLDEEQGYPFLLEQELIRKGYNYTVINAGVTAETSSGTLARMEWILTLLQPDIVILETGANDGLRGLDPNLARENVKKMLTLLQREKVDVLLAGMKMVWNLGQDYVARFNAIYPELAEEFQVELMPFFLEGVAMKKELNLPDGLHPNEDGYKIIAHNIIPYVIEVIDKRVDNE